MAYPYQQYPYMNYGGYGNAYPPTTMYGQQMLTNYPANNYYAGAMNPYAAAGAGYYPNQAYMGNQGYYGYGGAGAAYGGYGGYGGYGAGTSGYYPYKQSTLRNIFNRIRHGSSYGYGYPNQMLGYEYGRHRGSWIDYQ